MKRELPSSMRIALILSLLTLGFSSVASAQNPPDDSPNKAQTPQLSPTPMPSLNRTADGVTEKTVIQPFKGSNADQPTHYVKEGKVKEITTDLEQQKETNLQKQVSVKEVVVSPKNAPQGSLPSQFLDNHNRSESKFETFYELTSHGTIFNNLDFRPIAPPTAPFIDILDSDDKTIFATTVVAAGLKYRPIDQIETGISVSHVGNWGSRTNGYGTFAVERLFATWKIWKNRKLSFDATFGRQKFELGSFSDPDNRLFGHFGRDYIFSSAIDGVTINANFGKVGSLRLMPIDIFAVGIRPEDTHTASPVLPTREATATMRFNGEYNTIRTGLVYENTKLLKGLAARGYFFYANIGSAGTGSDRTSHGATGNVSDRDFNWIAGLRLNYVLPLGDAFALGFEAEYARSGGIDRKAVQIGFYDVNNSGNAFGAKVIPALNTNGIKLAVPLQFFMADGDRYTQIEGLPYSHGFTGFKGQRTGGLLLGNGLGWRPSAIVGDGVSDTPHEKTRQAGTMMISAGIDASFLNDLFGISLDVWYLKDTAKSAFDLTNIAAASAQPAFGYTRSDLEALQRVGKTLATEIDLGLNYSPFDIFSLYAVGGVLLPGKYYKTEIDRRVGNYLGSSDPTIGWGFSLGMTLAL